MTQSTHAEGCWTWGPKHYECALTRLAEAEKDARRYRWLADKVIAPDYGDNPWRADGKGKGYWIDRCKGPAWIEGETLDAAIDAALTRLAEAEKKLDYMHNVHRACGEALSDEMHKRKEAEQRAASAEKDAARYRYMKANCVPVMAFNTQPLDSRASPGTAYVTSGGWTDIDAAIDTALAQSKEPTV